ncbi:MAG: hypothetical protein ACD_72C00442G0010 [uncultured bacterium]|nr:MAG: hypothetical protein ACD_72C00442G0010 [uncultured bacterium]
MKKIILPLLLIIADSVIIIFLIVSLGLISNNKIEKNIISIPIVSAEVPSTIESSESVQLCDNEDEVQYFPKPIPIVWKAKLMGCLVSCEGASFERIPTDVKYPYFAGYGPAIKAIIDNVSLVDMGDVPWGSKMPIKIYGQMIGIDADHPRTVFNNKCVPIVDIDRIEKL